MEKTHYFYRNTSGSGNWLIERMIELRELSPAARSMTAEQALDQLASAYCIDRNKPYTINTDFFPIPCAPALDY